MVQSIRNLTYPLQGIERGGLNSELFADACCVVRVLLSRGRMSPASPV